MEDFESRVIQEEIELREKIVKLYSYLLEDKLNKRIMYKPESRLTIVEGNELLYKQLNAMEDYHTILCERIKYFKR